MFGIDRILIQHNGFTAQELADRINHNIKYRMGRDRSLWKVRSFYL